MGTGRKGEHMGRGVSQAAGYPGAEKKFRHLDAHHGCPGHHGPSDPFSAQKSLQGHHVVQCAHSEHMVQLGALHLGDQRGGPGGDQTVPVLQTGTVCKLDLLVNSIQPLHGGTGVPGDPVTGRTPLRHLLTEQRLQLRLPGQIVGCEHGIIGGPKDVGHDGDLPIRILSPYGCDCALCGTAVAENEDITIHRPQTPFLPVI